MYRSPSFRFAFVTVIVGAFVGVLAACQQVPITGRTQVNMFGDRQLTTMGLQAFDEIKKKEKVSTDPRANDLVKRVGQRIAAVSGKPDYQWEFVVFESDKVNAFCLPGGKVGVYTALLPVAKDEAGLAVVMGHEIAHAIANHGGERLTTNMGLTLGAAAVGVAAASKSSDRSGQAVGLLAASAAGVIGLKYSRDNESEADRIGLVLMAKAGYDPRAAVGLWNRMGESSRGKARPPEWLSTHPAEDTRIQRIESYLPEAYTYYKAG